MAQRRIRTWDYLKIVHRRAWQLTWDHPWVGSGSILSAPVIGLVVLLIWGGGRIPQADRTGIWVAVLAAAVTLLAVYLWCLLVAGAQMYGDLLDRLAIHEGRRSQMALLLRRLESEANQMAAMREDRVAVKFEAWIKEQENEIRLVLGSRGLERFGQLRRDTLHALGLSLDGDFNDAPQAKRAAHAYGKALGIWRKELEGPTG